MNNEIKMAMNKWVHNKERNFRSIASKTQSMPRKKWTESRGSPYYLMQRKLRPGNYAIVLHIRSHDERKKTLERMLEGDSALEAKRCA